MSYLLISYRTLMVVVAESWKVYLGIRVGGLTQ